MLLAGASLGAVAMLGGCTALALAGRRRGNSRAATARAAEGPLLTLGTRGSPLALAQAYEAKRRLGEARPQRCAGWEGFRIWKCFATSKWHFYPSCILGCILECIIQQEDVYG